MGPFIGNMSFPTNTGIQCSYLMNLELFVSLFDYLHNRSHQFDPFTTNVVDFPV